MLAALSLVRASKTPAIVIGAVSVCAALFDADCGGWKPVSSFLAQEIQPLLTVTQYAEPQDAEDAEDMEAPPVRRREDPGERGALGAAARAVRHLVAAAAYFIAGSMFLSVSHFCLTGCFFFTPRWALQGAYPE